MTDAPMTRPSEAEVTDAMVEAAMTTFGFSSDPDPSRSAHWVKCAIRAALSTPPLPRSEPVAGPMQIRVNLLCPKGHTRGIKLSCDCDTTPPAAAQDVVRLTREQWDALADRIAQVNPIGGAAPLGVTVAYHIVRMMVSALDAARAAGGE